MPVRCRRLRATGRVAAVLQRRMRFRRRQESRAPAATGEFAVVEVCLCWSLRREIERILRRLRRAMLVPFLFDESARCCCESPSDGNLVGSPRQCLADSASLIGQSPARLTATLTPRPLTLFGSLSLSLSLTPQFQEACRTFLCLFTYTAPDSR